MGRFMDAVHAFSAPKAARVTETGSFGWNGGHFPLELVSSGEAVTPNTALTTSAVYASVRVLAEAISSLPIKIFQTVDNGKSKRLATEHPLNVPLRLMPNPFQDKVKFWDQGVTHLNLRGNMYAEIKSGPRFGAVDELVPIHPDSITKIEKLDNERLRYTVRRGDGSTEELAQDQVLHISGPLSQDGVTGMSPIMAGREGIGLSIAAQKYGGKFYGNSAIPSVALTFPKDVKPTEQAIANAKQSWNNQVGGDNQQGLIILGDGMTAAPMSVTPEDAQTIETRKFQVSDIARLFRVPPHLIGDLERATFSNIEEMDSYFVKYSLVPWLTRIELALMTQLMSDEDLQAGFFIEFVVAGLLRGDLEARFNSYAVGIPLGIYNPNEVRRLENLNPRDGGDEYVASQNTRPSGGNDNTISTAKYEMKMLEAEAKADAFVAKVDDRAAFVADAAKRIANAEIREIGKHIKHAATDREKFNAWVKSYLTGSKHRRYVEQTIEPFGASDVSTDIICNAEEWMSANPVELLEAYKQKRAVAISALITEGMNSHDE